jgi:sterol desaturase/sphingolipid hydroxylase (fatty acid hydroxylase superfamily)
VIALEWLHRLLTSASPYTLAVNVPYALAFALVGAEVAWLARRPGPGRTRILGSAATATTMAVGALVVGVLYTAALQFLWEAVATFRWEPAAALWHHQPVMGAVVTFVAWDLSGWVYHLIGHRTRVGWAAHQPHHSGEDYDATLGLRQSWAPFHGLVHHPLLALFGFDLRVVFVCAAVSNCWQVLEHTSLPVRFPGWLEAHVMTPAAHRHHHGRDGGQVNLGPFFTWWDRLAGTWVAPDEPPPAAYGPAVRAPANPVAVELAGWVALARRHARPRAERYTATWAITMAGIRMANTETAPWSRAGRDPSQTSPSRARATIQPPRAREEPAAALGARTKPYTTTTTTAASITRAMTRAIASAPPSSETASASMGPPPSPAGKDDTPL